MNPESRDENALEEPGKSSMGGEGGYPSALQMPPLRYVGSDDCGLEVLTLDGRRFLPHHVCRSASGGS